MLGTKTLTIAKHITKNMKNCKKLQKIAKMQKVAKKKNAIFLKIAKNRGPDFPEGQIHTYRNTFLNQNDLSYLYHLTHYKQLSQSESNRSKLESRSI